MGSVRRAVPSQTVKIQENDYECSSDTVFDDAVFRRPGRVVPVFRLSTAFRLR